MAAALLLPRRHRTRVARAAFAVCSVPKLIPLPPPHRFLLFLRYLNLHRAAKHPRPSSTFIVSQQPSPGELLDFFGLRVSQ